MGWPDDQDLPVRVEAAFGADLTASPATWVWTDLSSRLKAAPIHAKVPSESMSPGTCTLTLLNDDAALTPLHPMSPFWPHVEMGTPLRVRVQWAGTWHDRFSGVADQWEPTFIPIRAGESASAVRVTCSGILRRLTQGESPEESPLRRAIGSSGPVAYWPLEDGVSATQGGSALPGHPPAAVVGAADFVAVADYTWGQGKALRFGTGRVISLRNGGTVRAALPAPATAATRTTWTVSVSLLMDELFTSGEPVLLDVSTPGGTYTRWQLIQRQGRDGAPYGYELVAHTETSTTSVLLYPSLFAAFAQIDISVWQDGSTIRAGILRTPAGGWVRTGAVAGTLAGITSVSVNSTRVSSVDEAGMPVGHLAVWALPGLPARVISGWPELNFGGAVYSYRLEPATARLARLAAEDGIALAMPAVPADAVVPMGWQPAGASLEMYQQCEAADGGRLYEQGFGLGYVPRGSRYNPPIALTVDLATYQVTGRPDVLAATYDDQNIRNRWTVERTDGSSVVVDDRASQRRGVYSDSVELNLASDEQLLDQAGHRLGLTTVVDLREESFPLDLAANPNLVAGWLACGVGARIVRVNPPAQYRPGALDRIVTGWTETIGPRSWLVQVESEPAAPWQVAVVDDGGQRLAADGVALAEPLSPTGMTLQLATPVPWTTAGLPVELRVGGERVRATAVAGTTVTLSARGLNGVQRQWPAGTPVDVWAPAILSL